MGVPGAKALVLRLGMFWKGKARWPPYHVLTGTAYLLGKGKPPHLESLPDARVPGKMGLVTQSSSNTGGEGEGSSFHLFLKKKLSFKLAKHRAKATGARAGVTDGSRGEGGALEKEKNFTLNLLICFTKRLIKPEYSPRTVIFIGAVIGQHSTGRARSVRREPAESPQCRATSEQGRVGQPVCLSPGPATLRRLSYDLV